MMERRLESVQATGPTLAETVRELAHLKGAA